MRSAAPDSNWKRSHTTTAFVVSVIAMVVACGGGSTGVEEDRPGSGPPQANVLLITIDTLRADYLGVYGSEVSTPYLDALAEKGVLFTHARAHIPITGPSHSSLFTSLLPMEHGVLNNGHELSDRFMTLAESMAATGRQTAAVISLGVMKGRFGLDRGFEVYGDKFPRDWMKNGTEVTDEVLAVFDQGVSGPFFFWAHFSDPHEPYAPPDLDYTRIELHLDGRSIGRVDAGGRGFRFDVVIPAGESELELVPLDTEPGRLFHFKNLRVFDPAIEIETGRGWQVHHLSDGRDIHQTLLPASLRISNPSTEPVKTRIRMICTEVLDQPEIRRRYAQEVEFVDREIGRLLASLEDRGLLDDTLVILTGDHGEGLGDHDHVGHISQLYDTLLEVPLILAWPGKLPQGLVIDHPASLVDLFPTLCDLLGSECPPAMSGASLMPAIRGSEAAARPFIASTHAPQSASDKRAIVSGGFKYIHSWTDDRDWEELYDLSSDPGELVDLAGTHPEMLGRLRAELERCLAESAEGATVEVELSDEEEAQLRALGYVR